MLVHQIPSRIDDTESNGGGRGHHLQYELLYDGGDAHKHLCGLLDPMQLQSSYDYDKRKLGEKERKSVPSQPQVSPKLAPSQCQVRPQKTCLCGA